MRLHVVSRRHACQARWRAALFDAQTVSYKMNRNTNIKGESIVKKYALRAVLALTLGVIFGSISVHSA